MNWLTLSIVSALTLGLYEIARKFSLAATTPFRVLFLSACISGLLMIPSAIGAPAIPFEDHLWIALKALIISISWAGEFYALKRLQLSMGMAVRSSGPIFTTAMAVVFFSEAPSLAQWIGIGLVICGYFQFIALARRHKSQGSLRYRWLGIMLGATLLGTVAGGIDRYLMKSTVVTPLALQAWFSVYTPLLLFPAALYRRAQRDAPWKSGSLIQNRSWAIPLISILLLLSDRLYFSALAHTGSSLAVVGALRRGSIIVSVLGGGVLFKEGNMRGKASAILMVFIGLVILRIFGG